MDLREYRQMYGRDAWRRLAKAAGVSTTHLEKLSRNERPTFSISLAKLLVELTNGELDLDSMVFDRLREAEVEPKYRERMEEARARRSSGI